MKTGQTNFVVLQCLSCGDSGSGAVLQQGNVYAESFKLIYFCGADSEVTIDGRRYPVRSGESALVYPFCRFGVGGGHYVWVEFRGLVSEAIVSRIAVAKDKPVLGRIGIEGFERFFAIPKNNGEPYMYYRLGGCLLQLLSYYIEKFPRKIAETDNYVLRACRLIENNYDKSSFSVREIVAELKIDRSYLFRLFKNKMGTSVQGYLTGYRLKKAEVLLANSTLSVKDVAYSCGFSDQMYFSRVFRRAKGQSPTDFRQKILRSA